jgi:hypothetical protein
MLKTEGGMILRDNVFGTPEEDALRRDFTVNALFYDPVKEEVWDYQNYPTTRTVDNHVLSLRAKLEGEPAEPRHLITVHGVGYKFVP